MVPRTLATCLRNLSRRILSRGTWNDLALSFAKGAMCVHQILQVGTMVYQQGSRSACRNLTCPGWTYDSTWWIIILSSFSFYFRYISGMDYVHVIFFGCLLSVCILICVKWCSSMCTNWFKDVPDQGQNMCIPYPNTTPTLHYPIGYPSG